MTEPLPPEDDGPMTDPTTSLPPAPPPSTPSHAPVGRILLVVAGAFLVLVALGLSLAGAGLTWAHTTQRDADGFFSSPTERLDTAAPVIVSDEIDLGVPQEADWFAPGDLATVRIEVAAPGDDTAFVGVGPAEKVEAYLEGVAQSRIADVELDPFEVSYRFTDGGTEAAPPADQDFWVAVGGDGRPLEWEVDGGDWVVVVMNEDGSAGVSVLASVGAKVDWLLPLALVLLFVGLGLGLVGTLLLVFGAIGLNRHAAATAPAEAAAPAGAVSPVRVTGHRDEPVSRWLWLVKWVLLVPHVIALAVLWFAVAVVTVIAFFAIVFTGRYPRGLFDFTVGVLRWSWRVGFYSYSALGTDRYPPFSLGPEPDYPATLEVDYPERLSRGLVWVKSWLLAIPHLIVVGILTGAAWDEGGTPGLVGVLVVIAGIWLLFTGGFGRSLFDLLVGLNRWVLRVAAYVLLLRDEYPPFRLDQGPEEPVPADVGGEPGPAGPLPVG